jgi:hypothetical protein
MKLDTPTITKLSILIASMLAITALAIAHVISGTEATDKIVILTGIGMGGLSVISVAGILGAAFGQNAPASPDAKPSPPPTANVAIIEAKDTSS